MRITSMHHTGLVRKVDCLKYMSRGSKYCVRSQGLAEDTACAEYPRDRWADQFCDEAVVSAIRPGNFEGLQ